MANPADLLTPSQTSPAARSPRLPGRRVPCSRDRPSPTGARRSRRPRAVARGPAGPGAASQWWADVRRAPAGTDDLRGDASGSRGAFQYGCSTSGIRRIPASWPPWLLRAGIGPHPIRCRRPVTASCRRAARLFEGAAQALLGRAGRALLHRLRPVELCVHPLHADPARIRFARGRAVAGRRADLAAAPRDLPPGHPHSLPPADLLLRRHWPAASARLHRGGILPLGAILQLLLRLSGDVRDHGADPPEGDPSRPRRPPAARADHGLDRDRRLRTPRARLRLTPLPQSAQAGLSARPRSGPARATRITRRSGRRAAT